MNFMPGTRNAMRRRLWAVLIGAGMLAAGCGGENQRAAEKIEVVPGLRVQKIQLRGVADELEAPGTVIAVSTAQVAARTMGTVLQVAVREGDSSNAAKCSLNWTSANWRHTGARRRPEHREPPRESCRQRRPWLRRRRKPMSCRKPTTVIPT